MTDIPEPLVLPELQSQILDEGTLASLVRDVRAVAEGLEVRVKAFAERRIEDVPWELDEALATLRAGKANGVQLRYRHAGELWLDTLMRTPEGIRLVRMQAPSPKGQPGSGER